MTIAICGIRFFYEKTLHKQWTIFNLVLPAPEKKLPVILTIEEVLLDSTRQMIHVRQCEEERYSYHSCKNR